MSKKFYVYSTMAAAVQYPVYTAGGGDLQVADSAVTIQGGANIPDKYMRTPDGAVVTTVSEDELAALNANPVFKLHEKNGFIRVSGKNTSGEKVAADMEGRDKSAPLVDQDFEAEGKEPPKVAKLGGDDEEKPKPSGRKA